LENRPLHENTPKKTTESHYEKAYPQKSEGFCVPKPPQKYQGRLAANEWANTQLIEKGRMALTRKGIQ